MAVTQPLWARSWRDHADQPSVKVTVGLTGVATLTIEGHEQGDPEYPKIALGDHVLHGL
ncbi:hypothetical protein ACFVW5_19700 [Streptomyces sp. NPDC058232]|uniref:hypothetical protein n=1 Tax=Streptomyces sp. NPDC058232 TaxID=3346393 RepID=UPI0036E86581